jgi:UDP-N-acetylglucosamine:LPS N-acetylglucosamine transferase
VRLDPKGRFREQCHHELAHFFAGMAKEQEREPPLLTFAVGGAGAQSGLVEAALPGLRQTIISGALRIALVAGTHFQVAARFRKALAKVSLDKFVGRGISILHAADHDEYFDKFDELIARTDVLFTKPSELTFYAALGIPLLLTPPVGVHERFNRRFAREQGVGLKLRNPRHLATQIHEWLSDGTLAAAAWSGFLRLPKFGTYNILEEVCGSSILDEPDVRRAANEGP